MKLPPFTISALVWQTEDALFVSQEELQKIERDILKIEDHLPTAIPTRSQKYWSRLVAWTNKQLIYLFITRIICDWLCCKTICCQIIEENSKIFSIFHLAMCRML